MIGTTGVPPVWSNIFLFLSVFRVISVIFGVVFNLRTEIFVIGIGIVLFVVL
jgi:hypothetical protein